MRLRKTGWILVGLCVLAGFSCGTDKATNPPPDPQAFSVEAESYTGHYNVDGSMMIQRGYCTNASGQHVALGMDREGEWIELALSVPEAGLYDVTVRYSAPRDSIIVVTLTSEDCGGEQEPEFTLDEGEGVG